MSSRENVIFVAKNRANYSIKLEKHFYILQEERGEKITNL